ncbi:hypothetical protein Bca101_019607 [Brassica carinata]
MSDWHKLNFVLIDVKSSNGDWSFEETAANHGESVMINKGESFHGLVELIRIRLNLGILTPVSLAYQLPEWMLVPDGPKMPLITLSNDKDVEIMTSVTDYMTEALLYVTSRPELVAKYEFFCRSPFNIADKTYLGEGVTEDEHRQVIIGTQAYVGDNVQQLLIVFRVALEIEMVYAMPTDDDETQDPAQFPRLTFDNITSMEEGVTISPDDPTNYNPNDEGMAGVISFPLAPNRRVSAPQPATIIIIYDDDDGSTTGSFDGINENDYITSDPPPADIGPIASELSKNAPTVMEGDSSAGVENQNAPPSSEFVIALTPAEYASNAEPCLDLTLGFGNEKTSTKDVPLVEVDDSSSEDEESSGGSIQQLNIVHAFYISNATLGLISRTNILVTWLARQHGHFNLVNFTKRSMK